MHLNEGQIQELAKCWRETGVSDPVETQVEMAEEGVQRIVFTVKMKLRHCVNGGDEETRDHTHVVEIEVKDGGAALTSRMDGFPEKDAVLGESLNIKNAFITFLTECDRHRPHASDPNMPQREYFRSTPAAGAAIG